MIFSKLYYQLNWQYPIVMAFMNTSNYLSKDEKVVWNLHHVIGYICQLKDRKVSSYSCNPCATPIQKSNVDSFIHKFANKLEIAMFCVILLNIGNNLQ